MDKYPVSGRMVQISSAAGPVLQFISDPRWEERNRDPLACDFMLGNPQEFPLPGVVRAFQKNVEPQNKDWFAYKMNEERAREIVAASLQKSHHLPFAPDDITMTTGAFAGLAASLGVIVDPGDEVIYISPPWFFYETLILGQYGKPVRVRCDSSTFDLDLKAIEQAITPKTRGIIINTPNNPTGRIYPPETLTALGDLLDAASRENGRRIYLLSDEAYNHILYDGHPYFSPAAFYPYTFLIYTYGKTLLTPGQRLGYVAFPPGMPERQVLSMSLMVSLVINGFDFPNALLQHSLEELDRLSIDVSRLQARRDRIVGALRDMGYDTNVPEGTFYVLFRSPLLDDRAFFELLVAEKIYCLPGAMFDMPGFLRISLTANDEMIDRSLPGFERALAAARSREVAG